MPPPQARDAGLPAISPRCNIAGFVLYGETLGALPLAFLEQRQSLPVFLTMLKAKLHRATVTASELDYEGSIAIDRDFLDASGILPYEQVDVLNINNGARFTTYAIEAPRGSRAIAVNGAAARLAQKNDKVIIVCYGHVPAEEARNYKPTVVLFDDRNDIVKIS
jgi:aspartate 1-decarboxylase